MTSFTLDMRTTILSTIKRPFQYATIYYDYYSIIILYNLRYEVCIRYTSTCITIIQKQNEQRERIRILCKENLHSSFVSTTHIYVSHGITYSYIHYSSILKDVVFEIINSCFSFSSVYNLSISQYQKRRR